MNTEDEMKFTLGDGRSFSEGIIEEVQKRLEQKKALREAARKYRIAFDECIEYNICPHCGTNLISKWGFWYYKLKCKNHGIVSKAKRETMGY